MEWSDELTSEFLDLYFGEPVIWNPQHEHHKNRNHVYDAWKRIQRKLNIDCSLEVLKKKKENLLSTYRKLTIKVKNSVRTGAAPNEVFKPEWLFYEKISSFLDSVYTPRTKTAESQLLEEEDYERLNMSESSGQSVILENEEVAAVNVDVPRKGKKRKAEHIEKYMDEAYRFLKQVASKPKVAKDESYLFCELLCCRLRKLDDHSREMAMHEIDNLMYDFQKNSSVQLNYYHQQPGYFQRGHAINQDNETSVPNMSSAPSPSSETQHSLNGIKTEINLF